MRIIYCGLFIEASELYAVFPPKLAKRIEFPHVTTKFKPGGPDLHEDLLGREFKILANAYACDGKNEGLGVEILDDFPQKIEIPHITISVGEGAKPVDTAKLSFEEIEPVELTAKYGWFCDNGKAYFG